MRPDPVKNSETYICGPPPHLGGGQFGWLWTVFNTLCFKVRLIYTYFDLKVSSDLAKHPKKTGDMFGWEVARETLCVRTKRLTFVIWII